MFPILGKNHLSCFSSLYLTTSNFNNKLDIFEIYTKWGVGKCPRWTFFTLRKPRKSINKSENSFGGHPVLLHIFKIKDQKQQQNTKPVENFWTNISKCYSFSETLTYFLALIIDSSTSYIQKLFTWLQMITLYYA